eukprot:2386675-Rhodomonas_salina.3
MAALALLAAMVPAAIVPVGSALSAASHRPFSATSTGLPSRSSSSWMTTNLELPFDFWTSKYVSHVSPFTPIGLRGGAQRLDVSSSSEDTSSDEDWDSDKLKEEVAAMGSLPWDDEPDSSSEQDPNKIAEDDKEKLPWECYY